jgi:hypothetical protein
MKTLLWMIAAIVAVNYLFEYSSAFGVAVIITLSAYAINDSFC